MNGLVKPWSGLAKFGTYVECFDIMRIWKLTNGLKPVRICGELVLRDDKFQILNLTLNKSALLLRLANLKHLKKMQQMFCPGTIYVYSTLFTPVSDSISLWNVEGAFTSLKGIILNLESPK